MTAPAATTTPTGTRDTYLLLRAFCDELARCGVRHACTSPGSRCAPIVLSLVREPGIDCWSHIDERCAGFFALGGAKASGAPVAITCTSGTAAANLAPAVTEAFQSRVPLILLTADRPPELREVGAGQTIDQLKLYGDGVKWFFEVGVHDATPERLRWIRALASRACWTALDGAPGPVHLNFPLREPLVLAERLPAEPGGRAAGKAWITRAPRARVLPARPELPARGVIVAGACGHDPGLGSAASRFALLAGYPLLADPLSGARRGTAAVAHYDALLRDERFAGAMAPELVIRVGDLPTSKALRSWLTSLKDVAQVALGPEAARQDPSSSLTAAQPGDPVAGLESWCPGDPVAARERGNAGAPLDPAWLARWRAADDAAAEAIALALGEELSEPLVAARLGEWLPAGATLFVASSMPVRDVELCFPAREPSPRVLSNRGANGIDGTVSAAFGAAAVSTGPVVLLIGDVALAHDIGGLLAARRLHLPLTIVLLNNDGGGIFHFLPVAGEDAVEADAFERHVATPHGLDFAHAAALYGCGYERPESIDALGAALGRSLAASGTTIIEVSTDRRQNLALHRRIGEAVSIGLSQSVAEGSASGLIPPEPAASPPA